MTLTETKIQSPKTIGEFIEILKQFPEDCNLDLYIAGKDSIGGEFEKLAGEVVITKHIEDGNYKYIDLTVKECYN